MTGLDFHDKRNICLIWRICGLLWVFYFLPLGHSWNGLREFFKPTVHLMFKVSLMGFIRETRSLCAQACTYLLTFSHICRSGLTHTHSLFPCSHCSLLSIMISAVPISWSYLSNSTRNKWSVCCCLFQIDCLSQYVHARHSTVSPSLSFPPLTPPNYFILYTC